MQTLIPEDAPYNNTKRIFLSAVWATIVLRVDPERVWLAFCADAVWTIDLKDGICNVKCDIVKYINGSNEVKTVELNGRNKSIPLTRN